MKIGDRVKVARWDDYNIQLCQGMNIPLPIGQTGVVVDLSFSKSHGDCAHVLMDADGTTCIYRVADLDTI